MRLFICIFKESRRSLDDLLAGLLELDIKGATVLDAMGMGQVLTADISLFSGLKNLFPGGGRGTMLLLSVVSEEQVEPAIGLVEDVLGDLSKPGTGIVFTLPIDRVEGLARAIS